MALARVEGFDDGLAGEQRPLVVHVVRQGAGDASGFDLLANLCRLLVARHHRVRVVVCATRPDDPERDIFADGVEIIRIPWTGRRRLGAIALLFRHVADADLLHVHDEGFLFDALAWGRLLHGRPMVATARSERATERTGPTAMLPRLADRISAHAYRRLICSHSSGYRRWQPAAGDRATRIADGVDIETFAGCAALDPRRRIVAFGSGDGVERLLAVMQALAPRHPDWHLDIIGRPGDPDATSLDAEIRGRGLSRHVCLHPPLAAGAIRNLMSRASLYASASPDEGEACTAIKAMSAGLLPVLPAGAPFRALAQAHPVLTLADFAFPQQAARCIEAAYGQRQAQGITLRETLIRSARDYAWDKVAERYGAVYDEVLRADPRP